MTDQPAGIGPGRASIGDLQLLESCSFTWIFDGATRRFRRVPRHANVSLATPAAWTAYYRLEIDGSGSSFLVGLDADGTRILRAWVHVDPCGRCEREALTLSDQQARLEWWKRRLRVRESHLAAVRSPIARHPLRPFGGWAPPENAA